VLAAAPDLLPRSFDRGQYKPLIAQGLGHLMPTSLTASYWKPVFGCYDQHVLALSMPTLRECLFASQPWRSEQFVPGKRVQEAFARYESALTALTENSRGVTMGGQLMRAAGLETWLRGLTTSTEQAQP
jgi:hypothetical protein